MLTLLATSRPSSTTELAAALDRGLRESGVIARQIEAVGAEFPRLEALRIDLTNAKLTRDLRPSHVAPNGGERVEIARFEMFGAPIFFEDAAFDLRLSAERVQSRLEWTETRGSLALEKARTGEISIEIAREVLEGVLHRFAVEAAAKQGFEVRKTNLQFTQEGPRGLSFRAEVTAKVFIMSATLALTGRLQIDDELTARISGLALDGDGMVLKMASGFAKPHLDRLEGRAIPLLAFTAGGLQLQNLTLTAGATLRLQASLGSAPSSIT